MPVFIPVLIGALLVGGAVLWHWGKILSWAQEHLRPWISVTMPYLSPYLDDAFVALDRDAVKLRKVTKNAWQQLRRVLIKQAAQFVRQHDGSWTLRITSWLATQNPAQPVVRRETEQQLCWDEVPDAVREQYLRRHRTSQEIDITRLRDAQMLTDDV